MRTSEVIGTKVIVGNANNMLWFTHCVDHSFTKGYATKDEAMLYEQHSDKWCNKCRTEMGETK